MAYLASPDRYPFTAALVALARFAMPLSAFAPSDGPLVPFAFFFACMRDFVRVLRFGFSSEAAKLRDKGMLARMVLLDSASDGTQATEVDSRWLELRDNMLVYLVVGVAFIATGEGGMALLAKGENVHPALAGVVWWLSAGFKSGGSLLAQDFYDRSCNLVVGIATPPFVDRPWKARTISRFFSKHYNLAVHKDLVELVYRPMVSRGVPQSIAVLTVFFVCAIVYHAVAFPFFGRLTPGPYLDVVAFFMIEGFCVLLEKQFRLSGLLWFAVAFFAPMHLFLRSFGSLL